MNQILVVENEDKDFNLVKEWLETNLFTSVVVDRVEDVPGELRDDLQRPEERRFVAAIVDLDFGAGREEAGFEAIKSINLHSQIPVILFTGTADRVSAEKATQLKVFGVVLKGQIINGLSPKQQLLNCIRDALAAKRIGASWRRSLGEISEALDIVRADTLNPKQTDACARAQSALNMLTNYLWYYDDGRIDRR
jgi:CheY-like chemotaxis protein